MSLFFYDGITVTSQRSARGSGLGVGPLQANGEDSNTGLSNWRAGSCLAGTRPLRSDMLTGSTGFSLETPPGTARVRRLPSWLSIITPT